MFRVEKLISIEGQPIKSRPSSTQGGWTTQKSWSGLVQRLLHAIMTEDVFVFAMGGASAAAGHGYVLVYVADDDEKWKNSTHLPRTRRN